MREQAQDQAEATKAPMSYDDKEELIVCLGLIGLVFFLTVMLA